MSDQSAESVRPFPPEAIRVVADALTIQDVGMGNPSAPIQEVYTPEGQGIVVLSRLAAAGWDIRDINSSGSEE